MMNNNLTCSTTESILPPVELAGAAYNIGHDAVFSCKFTHRLRFTANVFATGNTTLSEILCRESRYCSSTAIFIDANVARTRANLPNKIYDY
ncbi:MAG: immunoglobulin domain-containing family protein, partial [Planctomycetota bacterium]